MSVKVASGRVAPYVRFGLASPGSATAMGMADGRGNAFGHLAVGSRGTITTASQMRKRRRSKAQTTIMLDNQTSMIFVSWSCFGKTGVNTTALFFEDTEVFNTL